jgi:hypothetical protein
MAKNSTIFAAAGIVNVYEPFEPLAAAGFVVRVNS